MRLTDGDLIYGIQAYREDTLKRVQERIPSALTIDIFNKAVLKLDRSQSLDTLDDQIKTLIEAGPADENDFSALREQDQPRFKGYVHHLIKTRILVWDSPYSLKEEVFFTEACQSAIEFIHLNGKKIYFILDGLDKDNVLTPSQKKFHSYTSSELRAAFRFWLNDRTYADTVLFYERGEPLAQLPWLDETGRILPEWRALISVR
jgi:hypothetical protein